MIDKIKIGSILILQGKSLKGKNRIRENGSEWKIVDVKETVFFSKEKGLWLNVNPISNPEKGRWIHISADKDFLIIEVK